jgi:hypothetical protein
MLVSAVLDPSAFDVEYFNENELYTIQAVDFLRGIQKNGLLIVDTENKLRDAFIKWYKALPSKPRGRLRILVEELLLKKRSRRIIACHLSLSNIPSMNLLDLAYNLKADTKVDALIVGNESLETLKSDRRFNGSIVPLSEYRDSDFETKRQRYESQVGPIDTLPKSEVDDLIIPSVRFTKWLRFYDAYIGSGENTSRFRKSIEYILSIWHEHGFFAAEQGIGGVEIFTRSANQIRDNETDHARESKLKRNQESHRRIIRKLIEPLNLNEDFPWPIRLFVKNDPDSIFHARYLETQHAIIRIDRGFDLFKQNGQFRRNFFTLNMAESSHLRECRELLDAAI